jgi:hypothetical protein
VADEVALQPDIELLGAELAHKAGVDEEEVERLVRQGPSFRVRDKRPRFRTVDVLRIRVARVCDEAACRWTAWVRLSGRLWNGQKEAAQPERPMPIRRRASPTVSEAIARACFAP